MPEQRITAAPEKELDELRKKQRRDRKKKKRIEDRMKDREKRIADAREDAQLLERLERAKLERPLEVIVEADRAADENDLPIDGFRAICLVVLKKETGIPQRAVFGCDHGPQGGNPPFCGDPVNKDNGRRFIAALHSDVWRFMNGVHWTQTTWYEKVFRVEKLSPDLTDPGAHMRVCFGDLALLVDAYGAAEAFRRYNGAGPAAEEYSRVCMSWLPGMEKLVKGT
jgi:hypothetical protein